jgi:hypothetical protein
MSFLGVIGSEAEIHIDGRVHLTPSYSCVFDGSRLLLWGQMIESGGQCVLLSGQIFGRAELTHELGMQSALA